MQKLIAYVAVFLSTLVLGTVAYQFKDPAPLKVSYMDLTPSARHQVNCLADNIYFEARSEPIAGQKAVAMVTMNRVAASDFPKTVCGVVRQQQQSICQFTWWCDHKLRNKSLQRYTVLTDNELYDRIRMIALEVYLNHGRVRDITNGALFYHADYVDKRLLGVPNLKRTVKIGQHIFYRTTT